MRVVIIGAGIIGLTTAYQLAKDGTQVTVVSARASGLGASVVNAGWVCPAEAAPVPGPGIIGHSLRWMLRRDSPLYIHPSLRPSYLVFLLRMWRHCDERHFRSGHQALLDLATGTMDLLDDYVLDGVRFEMHRDGLLVAFLSPQRFAEHQQHLDLAQAHGLEPRILVGGALRELEPALSDRVVGGIHFPHERHLDPATLVRGLVERCRELGVSLVEDAPVDRVEWEGVGVHAVRSRERRFSADAFVVAAGTWSGTLSGMFGRGLPIVPGKGYKLDLPAYPLRRPLYLSEARVAATPLESGLRLAGTMELGSLDERIDEARTRAISAAPGSYVRDWRPTRGASVGAGLRPMTPDGLPVIGKLPGTANVYVSTGHAMLGLTLAPRSAVELARLIVSGEASAVLRPFSADRFV
jgi:D-amino-acid dehydrogenase